MFLLLLGIRIFLENVKIEMYKPKGEIEMTTEVLINFNLRLALILKIMKMRKKTRQDKIMNDKLNLNVKADMAGRSHSPYWDTPRRFSSP